MFQVMLSYPTLHTATYKKICSLGEKITNRFHKKAPAIKNDIDPAHDMKKK